MPSSVTLDVDGLLRRIGTWTFALAAVWAAGLGLWLGGAMALGIAVGATLGYANLYFAARALRAIVSNPREHRPAPGTKWSLPAGLLLKWPLILLALGAILWYMPARPEGVALGVAISLAAASIAALQRSKPSGSPSS